MILLIRKQRRKILLVLGYFKFLFGGAFIFSVFLYLMYRVSDI